MTHAAIFAPAGYLGELARDSLRRAQVFLEQNGWKITVAPHVLTEPFNRFSAPIKQRLEELHEFLESPNVNVLLAARGGYGCSELLDQLDFALFKKAAARGLKICGHSDVNILNLALLANDVNSYVGPMAVFDFGAPEVNEFMAQHFFSSMKGNVPVIEINDDTAHKFAPNPRQIIDKDQTSLPKITGRMWGGNLTVLTHLIGTPYFPKILNGILFLEDINEHPYRIERMLFQLFHAGILTTQRAILFGDFSGYQLNNYDNGYNLKTVIDKFRDLLKPSDVPIFTKFPFGHIAQKVTLPLGALASIDRTPSGYSISFPHRV